MASVEPEPEVYRRRKSYRVDLNDKQRIIGGIGRRRSTANGPCSINDRILQYGKSTENGTAIGKPIELNNNEPVNIPRRRISTTSSPDIGKILSPQFNEKTINLTYFEKTISPQSNEKIVSPQSNEKITSSQNNEKAVNLECNEKFVNSQINEKTVSSQNNEKVVNLECYDKSIAPQVNEKNFSALNSEKAVNLECDEKNVSPQDNEKNLTSKNIEENIDFQCNEKTVKLQSNEKTFCAQINEKTINPQNNEKAINPQNKNAFQNPQTNTLKEENSHGDSLGDTKKVDVDTSCYQSKRSDRINSPILTRTFPVDNLETIKTQTKEVNPILNKRRSDSIAHSPQISKSPDRLISTVTKPGLPFYSALNGGHTENHGISLKMAADTIIRINKEEKLANAKKNNKSISPPLSINSARNKFLELEKHSTHLTDHQTAAKKIKAFKQKKSFDSSSSSVDYGNNKDKNAAENLDETTAQEPNIKTRSFNLIKRDENANSLQSHTDSEKCTIKDKSHLIEYQLSNNDPAIINNISNIEGELGNSSLIQIDGCSPDLSNHAIKSDRPLTSDSDTMLTENFEMDSNEVDVKIASITNGNSEDPSDNTYDNNNAQSAEESMQLKNKKRMRKTEDGDKNSEMVDKIDSIINSTLTDCETNFAKNKLDDGEPKCPAEEVQVNITDRQNPKSDLIYAVCDNAESNDTVKIKNCNSTWTPSDSDTSSNLDISELSSSSLYEDKESNKRRKLVKRRSRKAEQEYTQKSNQLPETTDDDALECNNSSDECKKSVHIGSSFFDNSINVTDYSSIDASNTSEIKTSLYSEKELSITQSSIVPKSNENLFTKDLNFCDNSEAATTYEISKSIKSSSMTAISNRLPQSLHSFSTSDMGGLESENQACNEMDKLENFKNFKQPGPLSSFTSISKVSTLKLQSFVTKNPMFSPPLRRRSNSSSENHGLTELSEGQHNIIQINPFSIKKQKDNKKCPENEKLNDNSLSKSYSLPRNMWLNQRLDIDKSSFSSAAKSRTPSEEEDSARTAEVLDSLPNSPFSLIARFSKDIEKFQVKSSVGSKNENYTDRENVPDNTIYNSYREPELSNKAKLCSVKNDTNYTQNQDEPKNINNNPKVKARPTLNMSSINRISVDESNTNTDTNIVSIRRRPSYLNANDEYFSCLNPSESTPENQVSENLVDDTEDIKKPDLVADVIPIEEHDSDSDEIELNDFRKIIENPDKHTTRTRPSYGQPGLPNIPEELGNNRHKFKKPIVSGVFPEDTISEESSDDNGECVLDKVDKVKSNHDDNLNTQKHLSLEDLTSDCKKLDGDGTKSLTSLPTINNEEKKKHSDIRTPKIITSSLSDPLLSNNLVKSPSCSSLNPQSTMSLGRSEETVSQVLQSTEKKKAPKVEMRMYVLNNLLETEQSYVQNLSTMISKFSEPLKRPENSNIIEPNVVDEIFFQIPEILEHHEIFLKQLRERANVWDDHQIIGDLFVTSFTKTFLMDAYSNFINNFIQAKAAIRQAVNSRPQFARYLEQCTREHREKLTLSDLLITPVQRIPRYKLLLLDMFKYTPEDHPDYENIQLAIEEIEALADRMNKGEMDADQAERDIDRLRDIESTIEGIQDLVTSSRRFIRQDLVAEKEGAQTKKDRCLFLFSDLLVCTTVRRKNNALRRGSLGLFTGQSAADMNRYKFLWKVHLDDVDISKATNPQAVITNSEIEKLEEDLQRLKTILSSIEALSVPHHNVEGSLRELTNDVRQQIQEKQWTAMQSQAPYKSRIDLQALTEDGMKEYTFIFLSTECKSSWSSYFEETKQKLVYSTDSFPPEFQYPVPITKTRSGMQFTCASPSQTMANYSDIMSPQQFVNGEVWVCNSDGYVGQVCLISMVPEAQSKASLSVCSVRILCLAAVPGGRLLNKQGNLNNHNKVANVMEFNPKKIKSRNRPLKKSLPSESDDDDPHNNAANIMAFDSSDDEDTESPYIGSSSFDGRMSPDGSSLGTVESQEGDHDSSDGYNNTSDEEDSARKDLRREYDHLSTDINEQTTMWLGTEDGNIYVYNASDVITQRKSKMKLQHGAPVTAILYFESRVFVALGSGELCIYTREQNANVWQISKPEKIQVSITGSPISCITAVAGRIWCGCQNTIVLVNAATLETETTFTVSPDHNKLVHKIVSSGLGVWVSMQNSATVRLYHATTYENVTEIDVTPAVNKMLAGADAIIRQHKSACLRVTSMLICKDLLWIGTSAGVILTNPLPSITASTSVLRNGLNPTGSPYGHTGHVRFLTLVEVSKSQFKTVESNKDNSRTSPWLGGNHSRRESTKSMRHDNDANGILTLVLSGGDGYEDFRFSQQSETVGRDDSTNHLLIWRV